MVIQCPECSTQYDLAEELLGESGKKVRCARCRNIFFATAPLSGAFSEPPAQEELLAEEVAPTTDSSIEDAFDFTTVTSAVDDAAETVDPDDGYMDGFVTEINEEDELVSEVNLETVILDDLADPLTDLEESTDELDNDLPIVEPQTKRSPMSTVMLLILLLLLALIAGTGYLMITDGADAPIKLLEKVLN